GLFSLILLLSNWPPTGSVLTSTVGGPRSDTRMKRPTRYLWLTLAGLAFAGLAPSTARASCGHYVLIGSPQKESNSQAPPARPTAAEQQLPAAPRPCSGPGCSEGHEPLLPLPTTPPSAEE